MKNFKCQDKKLQEILDSDDEIPFSYNEESEQPTYKNDNRFEDIVFKWINNSHISENENKSECSYSSSDIFNSNYIPRGFLSKQDIYCLNSIVDVTTDAIFLWLVDYFVHKNFEKKYYRQYCLADVYSTQYGNVYQDKMKCESDIQKCKYKINIIKNTNRKEPSYILNAELNYVSGNV